MKNLHFSGAGVYVKQCAGETVKRTENGSSSKATEDERDYRNKFGDDGKMGRVTERRPCEIVSVKDGVIVVDELQIRSGEEVCFVKECIWEKPIRFGFVSARNVMHFPRFVTKNFLNWNQKELTIVDDDTDDEYPAKVRSARRKGKLERREKFIAKGWYEFAKKKDIRRHSVEIDQEIQCNCILPFRRNRVDPCTYDYQHKMKARQPYSLCLNLGFDHLILIQPNCDTF